MKWIDIKNWEDLYQINKETGEIRKKDGSIVPVKIYHNSPTVNLVKNKKNYQCKVYILYFETFGESLFPKIENLKGEIWTTIPEHSKYAVSNYGRVKNLVTEKIKPLSDNGNGYLRVTLDGNVYYIHRIVAETYLSNPENKPQIDHINCVRSDNRLENLRWVDNKENMNNPNTIKHQNKIRTDLKLKNYKRQKWVWEIDKDGTKIALWCSATEAAKYYNVSNTAISNCLNGFSESSCGKRWEYFKAHQSLTV